MARTQLRVQSQQSSVGRGAEGTFVALRAARGGEAYTIDLLQALALEGRMFTAALGSASSPSAAMDAYDADRPEFVLDIPDGTTIIPVQVHVKIDTHGATLNETFALASRTQVAETGNNTAITINQVRTDNGAGISSNCTCYGTLTGNGTSPVTTGSFEFWRSGAPVDFDVAGEPQPTMIWSAQRFVPPVIVGSGSLTVYSSGTSPVGSITVTWAELAESTV